MKEKLRSDAEAIVRRAIDAVRPDQAVRRALAGLDLGERVYLVSVGKAGWQMAAAAVEYLPVPPKQGIVLTKYGHVMGRIPGVRCLEAGHPVPDAASFRGTEAVLEMTRDLGAGDTVLFLLSGGGSALFEKPLVEPEVLQAVTQKLLSGGADIVQINTVRKRLSGVKGGRFAQWCAPARVEAVILSDILGDPVDMIASGPAAADTSTREQALEIGEKFGLSDLPGVRACLERETPRAVSNVHTQIIGSVRQLCRAAESAARDLGYEPVFLTDRLDCEAREAGRWMASLLAQRRLEGKKTALIAGGETVVHVTGTGLGGRNQELALAGAQGIAGMDNVCLISVGSDGTDGPTDAAGGYADGGTWSRLGSEYEKALQNNDAYHALKAVDGLIITGPTGTNVNDVTIGLIG